MRADRPADVKVRCDAVRVMAPLLMTGRQRDIGPGCVDLERAAWPPRPAGREPAGFIRTLTRTVKTRPRESHICIRGSAYINEIRAGGNHLTGGHDGRQRCRPEGEPLTSSPSPRGSCGSQHRPGSRGAEPAATRGTEGRFPAWASRNTTVRLERLFHER